jgi:hypothetical protein
MVILYSYLKNGPNIVACIPFRYNIDDDKTVESREVVLEIEAHSTYDAIKQELLKIIDKEKMESGKFPDEYPSDMSGVVTIE